MTATTVQLATQAFITARLSAIPGLFEVNRAPVIQVNPTQFLPTGVSAGASSYLWLVRGVETVLSTGGTSNLQPNGWRQIRYDALLVFDYYVLAPSTSDDTWIDGLNNMCTGLSVVLRSDPTLGTSGQGDYTIFTSANQFPLDEPSITTVIDPPTKAQIPGSQSLLIHGSVDWPIYENVPPNSGS